MGGVVTERDRLTRGSILADLILEKGRGEGGG